MPATPKTCPPRRIPQRGFALLALLALLTAGILYFLVGQLDASVMRRRQDEVTTQALAQAKDALVGEAISNPIWSAGFLQVPDLGIDTGKKEGQAAGNFTGNSTGAITIGKVPWQTLDVPVPRDGSGECLWYVVSGNFKQDGFSTVNWDTLGQIDVIDGAGNLIATNVVALVVAPGAPLDGQNRSLADPSYIQCGGNYIARNYLDSYNSADAIGGEVNYFTGSTNNRVAPNASNKRFVMATGDHYNDRFLFITVDELFPRIINRSDFAVQVTSLLDDTSFRTHLQAVAISGSKGTANIDCSKTSNASSQAFCTNWSEMLLLKQLATAGPITVDGFASTTCSRVLFFGGEKTGAQVRITSADKANPANYLEGTNASAFPDATASSTSFGGASTFSSANPSADLVRCLP